MWGRNMKLVLAMLMVLGPLVYSSARAQSALQSVEQVLPGCRDFVQQVNQQSSPDLQFLAGICAGKVSTLLNLSTILEPQFRLCRPDGVTLAQTIEIVVKRLDGQPERLRQLFDGAVLATFVSIWP